jgi:hypothetical protein
MIGLLLAIAMQQQQQASICAVLRKPSKYLHQLISVPAEIVSAWPHGAYLLDKNCSTKILRLGADLPEAESTVTNLIPSIWNDCSYPKPDKIKGKFTGKLAYSADGRINLRLLSVELQIHPCDKPMLSAPSISPVIP